MTPDLNQAAEFLRWLNPSGPWSVGAIHPDDDGLAWLTTSDMGAVGAFVTEQSALGLNIYVQVNTCRPDLGDHRAKKEHVVVANVVHADVDPPAVPGAAELAAWQSQFAAGIEDPARWSALGMPVPTAVIFSGSGFQCLWRLAEPVALWRDVGGRVAQDPALVAAVEDRNYAALRRVDPGHPGTHNVDRLLRLPGTGNRPNAVKREKYGRTEPVMSFWVQVGAPVALADLPAEAAPTSAPKTVAPVVSTGLRVPRERLAEMVPDWLLRDCAEGPPPGGDRSRAGFSATCSLIKAGVDDETIAAVLGDPDYKISGHYVDQRDVERAIGRAIAAAHDEVDPELAEIRELRDAISGWVGRAPAPPPPAPSASKTKSWLEAARDKGRRSSVPSRRHESNVLSRVLKTETFVDGKELVEAAVYIARAAPDGFTADDLRGWLTPCASGDVIGRVPEIAAGAIEKVASARAADGVDAKDFEIDQKTLKPSSTSQKNMRLSLKLLKTEFSYDSFSRRKFMTRDGSRDVVQDRHLRNLMFEIEREHGYYPSKDKFYEYCAERADASTHHPVLDYLDGLPAWDGISRCETWLIDCAGAPDVPYVRAVSRLVLVAAVRRVRQPGCKFDEMLIIEGPQGARKSTALQVLCPNRDWFTDSMPLNADSKLLIERTAGKLIVEAPELRGMSNQDHNALKMMLSCTVDEARMAYGREVERVPRQFIIIGTTNDEVYLVDPTGNRRYLPVKITKFDIERLAEIRDQLWAEASYLDLEHPEDDYIRLHHTLYAAAAVEQEQRRQQDPFEDKLGPHLDGVTGILTIEDVLKMCGFDGVRMPNPGESKRINSVMSSLHWARGRRRRNGRLVRCFASPEAQDHQWLEVRLVGGDFALMPVKCASPPN